MSSTKFEKIALCKSLSDQIANLVKILGEDETISRTGGYKPTIVFEAIDKEDEFEIVNKRRNEGFVLGNQGSDPMKKLQTDCKQNALCVRIVVSDFSNNLWYTNHRKGAGNYEIHQRNPGSNAA